ncbi:MAG: hypothetical protein VYA34_16905 [Myxococcota bacterium]|nr:hypothetical protein [Myxococcota bacterium]
MFQTHTIRVFFSVLFSLSLLFGCGTPSDGQREEKTAPATATSNNKPDHENNSSAEDDVLFLVGSYVDNYGTEHTITQQSWTQGTSIFAIKEFSNTEKYVITQNDANNEYNPEKWSRFDWTIKDNTTWYCQTSYDSVTQEEAMALTPADATDPTSAGCSGFSWSKLIPEQGESWRWVAI